MESSAFSSYFCTIHLFTPNNKNMIYGYIRVSSDKQTVENQRFEINKFCKNERLNVDDWIEETISGTKNFSKRQLGLLWINIGNAHGHSSPTPLHSTGSSWRWD